MRQEHVLNGRDDSGRQRCLCKLCNRRFGDNPGFEYHHTSLPFIAPALVLNGAGMSPFSIRIMPEHMNVKVHADTVSRRLERHELAEKYTGTVQPLNLESNPGAGEKRQDVKGEENCFVMAMDLATRFILAWEATQDEP